MSYQKQTSKVVSLIFTLVIFTILILQTVNAEDTNKRIETVDAFMQLEAPTAQDLLNLHKSQDSDFAHFGAWKKLNRQEQLRFFDRSFVRIYAEDFIRRSSFSVGSATLKDEQHVAKKFFVQQAKNVNNNKISFSKYLISKGVAIVMDGDVQEYTRHGTIKAKNGEIAVEKLAKKYAFAVQPDNTIKFIPKDSKQDPPHWYTFTGTVNEHKGKMHLMQGTLDGVEVRRSIFSINSKGDVQLRTSQFGDFTFSKAANMVILKGKNGKPDRYRFTYPTKIRGIPQKIGGTFSLHDVENDGINFKQDLHVEPGNTAYVNGYKVKSLNSRVRVLLEKGAPGGGTDYQQGNTVFFASDNSRMYATGKHRNAYEVVLDPLKVLAGKPTNFFLNLQGTTYRKGYYYDTASNEGKNVAIIQDVLGVPATGQFDGRTHQALVAWQNAYNARNEFTSKDKGWLEPNGVWDEQVNKAYFKELSKNSRVTLRPHKGIAHVFHLDKGIKADIVGNVDVNAGTGEYKGKDNKLITKRGMHNPRAIVPLE